MAVQKIFFLPQRGFQTFNFDPNTNEVLAEDRFYELDAVIEERHQNNIKLTRHPIEHGADIADHAYREPLVIVVNGIVTNSPLLKQLARTIPGSDNFFRGYADSFTGNRIRTAYQGLLTIQNERRPMTLQTGLLAYQNMVLTKVSAPNDIQNNLRVSLTFEEILIAEDTGIEGSQGFEITTTGTSADIVTGLTVLAGLGIGTASLVF